MSVPLPNFSLHLRYFIIGLLGFIGVGAAAAHWPDMPIALIFILGLPCWLAAMIPFVGYFGVYPFLHLTDRYDGDWKNAWMIWLVLDTMGFTGGLVRVLYYCLEIIPDCLRARAEARALVAVPT